MNILTNISMLVLALGDSDSAKRCLELENNFAG